MSAVLDVSIGFLNRKPFPILASLPLPTFPILYTFVYSQFWTANGFSHMAVAAS